MLTALAQRRQVVVQAVVRGDAVRDGPHPRCVGELADVGLRVVVDLAEVDAHLHVEDVPHGGICVRALVEFGRYSLTRRRSSSRPSSMSISARSPVNDFVTENTMCRSRRVWPFR